MVTRRIGRFADTNADRGSTFRASRPTTLQRLLQRLCPSGWAELVDSLFRERQDCIARRIHVDSPDVAKLPRHRWLRTFLRNVGDILSSDGHFLEQREPTVVAELQQS